MANVYCIFVYKTIKLQHAFAIASDTSVHIQRSNNFRLHLRLLSSLFLYSNVVYSLCSLRYIVRPDGFRNSLDNIRSFCLSLSLSIYLSMLLGHVHVMFSIHLQWKSITATHKFGICTKYTKHFSC